MKKTDTSSTEPATTAPFDEALRLQIETFRDRELSDELTSLVGQLQRRLCEVTRRR